MVVLLLSSTSYGTPERVGPVAVELITDATSIRPGASFQAGLLITPDEHWHVYWKNPGDAGMPPHLKWELPDGFQVSDIHWVAPSLIRAAPLAAYGYKGPALYPVTITPPSELITGDTIDIKLKADWLVCKADCLPGDAVLSLRLPVTDSSLIANERTLSLFEDANGRIPTEIPKAWDPAASFDQDYIYFDFRPDLKLSDSMQLAFFAAQKAIIDYAAEQPLTHSDGSYRMKLKRSMYSYTDPDSLIGVLAISDNSSAEYFDVNVPISPEAKPPITASSQADIGLWLALLFAFVGGLILNLMPCVLPVLSIKVLGLVEQSDQSRRSIVLHGVLFALGVIITFWAVAGAMLLFQAGGEHIGWGFQLQSPTFVMILAAFMFLFALSLFGLFEINFLSGGAASLNQTRNTSGLSRSFMSGITATLVATPCTAPFMGAALGFTLIQPAVVSLLIYTAVGLGMASPYLILSLFPGLLRFIPKPGRWMESFKQAMGFLLAATAIWLGWLLANLAGTNALVFLLVVLLLISIAAWIYGRWGTVHSSTRVKWSSRLLASALILFSLIFGTAGISGSATSASAVQPGEQNDGIAWQPYSDAKLEELLAQKRSVFIDFTAAWCLSCKVNEKLAFSSKEVQQQFKESGIIPLVADWTQRSEEITKALAQFGRNSVPLYVVYPGKENSRPIILPQILTPGIVLDALRSLNN